MRVCVYAPLHKIKFSKTIRLFFLKTASWKYLTKLTTLPNEIIKFVLKFTLYPLPKTKQLFSNFNSHSESGRRIISQNTYLCFIITKKKNIGFVY